jgi:hypothetical protein
MVRGKVLVPGATGDTGRASVDEDLVEKLGGNHRNDSRGVCHEESHGLRLTKQRASRAERLFRREPSLQLGEP